MYCPHVLIFGNITYVVGSLYFGHCNYQLATKYASLNVCVSSSHNATIVNDVSDSVVYAISMPAAG
jgi:hypothetical protein